MAELMDADLAHAVYDVLAEFAGAPEWGRDDFVFMHVNGRCDEYRFVGDLGFGGKFWRHDWRVSAYPEDAHRWPEIAEAVAATNAALAALKQGVKS